MGIKTNAETAWGGEEQSYRASVQDSARRYQNSLDDCGEDCRQQSNDFDAQAARLDSLILPFFG